LQRFSGINWAGQLTDSGVLVAVAQTGKCTDISLETFSKVASIYDCALDPNHWLETLRLIV
jgi:hypothetical protein